MKQNLVSKRNNSIWDFMSEIERAFDDSWNASTSEVFPARARHQLTTFSPNVDVHENRDSYLITADLPGLSEKDVKIEVQDGRVTVSGERHREETHEDGMFKRVERSHGRFERSFQLPQGVNETKIEARMEHGVLEIMIPKPAAAQARTVAIETTKGGLFSRLLNANKVDAKTATKDDTH